MFSSTEDKKLINIFNANHVKILTDKSIKDQCQKDYFYGKDGLLEKALGFFENDFSPVIKQIVDTKICPKHLSFEHLKLCNFIIIQYARTLSSLVTMEDTLTKVTKDICKTHIQYKYPEEDSDKVIDSLKISFNNLSKELIRSTFPLRIVISDLHLHLLINKTSEKFITSDNPVFIYNHYLVGASETSSTGLSTKGLQIFIPFSPDVCLCLYDSSIYKCGDKKSTSTIINSSIDVKQINRMQYFNCLNNNYSNETKSFNNLEQFSKKREEFKSRNKYASEFEVMNENEARQFLSYTRKDVDIKLELSFIKIRTKQKIIPANKRPLEERDPILSFQVTDFINEVKNGSYNVFEFGKYIKNLTRISTTDAVTARDS